MTSNADAHSDNAAMPNGASETSTIGQSIWGWIEEYGWARVRYGTLGTGTHWVWTSASGWTRYTTPTEDVEAAAMHTESTSSHSAEPAPAPATDAWAGWHGSGSAYYDYSWKTWSYDSYRPKDKEGDVPEWDGRSMHRTIYFRKVDLWVATTGVTKGSKDSPKAHG